MGAINRIAPRGFSGEAVISVRFAAEFKNETLLVMKKLITAVILAAFIAAVAYFVMPRECDNGERKPYLICMLETPAEEQIDHLKQTMDETIQKTNPSRKQKP